MDADVHMVRSRALCISISRVTMEPTTRYLYLDGDDVGNRLELLLLDGNLADAAHVSDLLTSAMQDLRGALEATPNVEVRLCGGDDLIAVFNDGALDEARLAEIRSAFHAACGITVSAGVGTSVEQALSNLRRAKLGGKDRVVGNLRDLR